MRKHKQQKNAHTQNKQQQTKTKKHNKTTAYKLKQKTQKK